MIAHRAALGVLAVLGEHAPEHGHARACAAILRLALDVFEQFAPHGHARRVRADVEHAGVTGLHCATLLLLPLRSGLAHACHHARDAALLKADAAQLLQMHGSLFIAAGIGAREANHARERRGERALQPQGIVSGAASTVFASMMVVIALQLEAAKHALHLDRPASLASLASFGFVGCVNAIGSLLHQGGDELAGRFEDGGAHQFFHLSHRAGSGVALPEGVDQPLDLGLAGKVEVLGLRRFFWTVAAAPALRNARERSVRACSYWVMSSTNRS